MLALASWLLVTRFTDLILNKSFLAQLVERVTIILSDRFRSVVRVCCKEAFDVLFVPLIFDLHCRIGAATYACSSFLKLATCSKPKNKLSANEFLAKIGARFCPKEFRQDETGHWYPALVKDLFSQIMIRCRFGFYTLL